MATYVMSDLHGYYDTFLNMLKKINFSPADTLYIIGDVIDRGPKGIEILKYIMDKENIHMILGNHEYMCIEYFSKRATETEIRRWNRNGNYPSLVGLDNLSYEEFKNVQNFLLNLKDQEEINVNGTKYILVHGYLGDNTEDRVWNRPIIDPDVPLNKKDKIIIGHTPVCEYICPGTEEDMFVYSHKLTKKGKHFKILYTDYFIDIDCCLAYKCSASRLSCLRLDDMKEFYEKVED